MIAALLRLPDMLPPLAVDRGRCYRAMVDHPLAGFPWPAAWRYALRGQRVPW